MPQQQTVFRVKARKMFKASIAGALPVMVNPDDVVEVDRYMAGMLVQSEKAELTEEKPRINPNYKPPERTAAAGSDPIALLTKAVDNMSKLLQEIMSDRQKKLQH
jgi:hypothetical protein